MKAKEILVKIVTTTNQVHKQANALASSPSMVPQDRELIAAALHSLGEAINLCAELAYEVVGDHEEAWHD